MERRYDSREWQKRWRDRRKWRGEGSYSEDGGNVVRGDYVYARDGCSQRKCTARHFAQRRVSTTARVAHLIALGRQGRGVSFFFFFPLSLFFIIIIPTGFLTTDDTVLKYNTYTYYNDYITYIIWPVLYVQHARGPPTRQCYIYACKQYSNKVINSEEIV